MPYDPDPGTTAEADICEKYCAGVWFRVDISVEPAHYHKRYPSTTLQIIYLPCLYVSAG